MEYFVYFCNINVIKILGMEGILDMEFFGISVRWLLTFVIKGAIIYLVVRVLTGVTKYLFSALCTNSVRLPSTRQRSVSCAVLLLRPYI